MPFATVIAATDLTDRSAPVAARARSLARSRGAQVLLAHVRGDDTRKIAAADLEASLHEIAAEAGADGVRLLDGPVQTALADLARAEGAGLIVLGPHRERRVLDLLRLTTMERVVLAAPCPVLIARLPVHRPYRQVLLATDFSAASAQALICAARVAPEAEFHAIHALQVPLGREKATMRARAEQAREAFLARPGLPPLAEPPEIVEGGVHQVLAFRHRELDADLLCLGTQSDAPADEPERKPAEPRLGNYARDLVRVPPSDVLIAAALPSG
ncbi:hypothetical protein C4N9_18390 [Pararhodobacter marinus]|uniref:UspA domain-containing protein n=2 Tax=Pararhodobacter marinus TaxID=2184063 RepID=A0A2U2C613_9RHOB|nr:universal stress protein [Pararhodobacter marinus]PWE27271.1 hypothetical protein C4N9_18390 [Pararhodobacter marinus]